MSIGTWLMAQVYDRMMEQTEQACLQAWRKALLAPLQGDVLEIGAGTGVNLPFYSPEVRSLVVTEPDAHMGAKLRLKSGHGLATVLDCEAERLPLDSGRFDAVVGTLVMCTVADPQAALREVHRVLKPGGRFVFIEHVAAVDNPQRLAWQRRLEPLWKRVAGGCCLTRTTATSITEAGLDLEHMEVASLRKAPPWVRPSIRGTARKPLH